MDELLKAASGIDSAWPVLAIAIAGLYVLAWKFGGQVLAVVQASHSETKAISESIITNHGSKNIGDAIDRLTEHLTELHGEFTSHALDVDERLQKLESRAA